MSNESWVEMPWLQFRESQLIRSKENCSKNSHEFLECCDRAAEALEADAKVFLVEYRYGDRIVNGNGFQPSSLVEYLGIGSSDVPLGMVIEKQVEVVEEKLGNIESLEIIEPFEFFGAFETANRISAVVEEGVRTWEVTAGLTSPVLIYPLPQKNTKIRNRLMKVGFEKTDNYSDVMIRLAKDECFLNEITTQGLIDDIDQPRSWKFDWTCKVLVFPRQWAATSAEFREAVFKNAWRQAKGHIAKDGVRQKMLNLLNGAINLDLTSVKRELRPNIVAEVLATIEAAATGTAPAFVGSHKLSIEAGPFPDILNKLEGVLGKSVVGRVGGPQRDVRPRVLVPKKLGIGEIGIIKVQPFEPLKQEFIELIADKHFAAQVVELSQHLPVVDWNAFRLVSKNNGHTDGNFYLPAKQLGEVLFKDCTGDMLLEHPFFKGGVLVKRTES